LKFGANFTQVKSAFFPQQKSAILMSKQVLQKQKTWQNIFSLYKFYSLLKVMNAK